MFIGHVAVGLFSKRIDRTLPLGWLVAAPMFLDLLWPLLLALGIETVRIDPGNTAMTPLDLHDYPWSHSLLMAAVWSVVFAALFYARHRTTRGAAVIGAGVFSHWVLDFVTHRPDMPLYPGSDTYLGLGLWNSVPATVLVEGTLFAASVALYAKSTRARTRTGSMAWWSFVGLLVLIYVGNIFSPPPPAVTAVIGAGFALWLLGPWGAWIERHRENVSPTA